MLSLGVITFAIITYSLQFPCAVATWEQKIYSIQGGKTVLNTSVELISKITETIGGCAMTCADTTNCVAADFDWTTQTCRAYNGITEYQDADDRNSALVMFGSCPVDGTGVTCK